MGVFVGSVLFVFTPFSVSKSSYSALKRCKKLGTIANDLRQAFDHLGSLDK
jgi:hypothetical protein